MVKELNRDHDPDFGGNQKKVWEVLMSDVEKGDRRVNPDVQDLFEQEWINTNDSQKIWFLIKYYEIEKLSSKYDNLKNYQSNNNYKSNNFITKKDVIIYRSILIILLISFILSITFIKEIKTLIISISILYLIFKFVGSLLVLDEYDIRKNKNLITLKNEYEINKIEQTIKENYIINSEYFNVYQIYNSEQSLLNFVKTNYYFRLSLLRDCKEDFD